MSIIQAAEDFVRKSVEKEVVDHTLRVRNIALKLAETEGGDKELIELAALLHDIEREKDNHVVAGEKLLKNIGFPEVAKVAKKHSLYEIEKEVIQPNTIEEKILFYADKRVIGNKIVSLEERFEDLKKRYDVDLTKEFEFAKKIEKELLKNDKRLL